MASQQITTARAWFVHVTARNFVVMASDQETRPGIGEVAKDLGTGKIGFVMGEVGGKVQLRPLNGGKEWDAEPSTVRPAPAREELSARLAATNNQSRWGR
ncbi:hypothetical protein [Streptomyces sp. NPDC006879]|uniref:hypothetical protein n=1 Tax=Streptomyces sp. NPDC006879 TaxID=3364767 RepID=UPI0036ADA83C